MRAMVLAAGRGERMRPLTNDCPKPLLPVGGKPLIVWQIERLARAGFNELVINVSYLAEKITGFLGDGSAFGVRIAYSPEAEPMESAGGIAHALSLLGNGPVLVAASDVYTEFDYARLRGPCARIAGADATSGSGSAQLAHLVLVANPPFRPQGDYALSTPDPANPYGRVGASGNTRWTWTGIGIFHTDLLREIPIGKKIPLLPFFADWIGRGVVGGELYEGVWDNLGTPEQLHRLDVKLAAAAAHGYPMRGIST
jgi:MurNAc alpha-1-phosphate uridylyltransferase